MMTPYLPKQLLPGHAVIKEICLFIKNIVAAVRQPKFTYQSIAVPEEVKAAV